MTRCGGTANLAADRPRTGLAAYAFAFAILALQLTGPLHLDQHDVTEADESCAICVQLEQFGNALVAAPTTAAALPGTDSTLTSVSVIAVTGDCTGYYSRAPPLSA